jgi:hypothetical protein
LVPSSQQPASEQSSFPYKPFKSPKLEEVSKNIAEGKYPKLKLTMIEENDTRYV